MINKGSVHAIDYAIGQGSGHVMKLLPITYWLQ